MDDVDRVLAATRAVATRHGLTAPSRATFLARFRLPVVELLAGLGVDAGDLDAAEREWNTLVASRPARLTEGAGRMIEKLGAAGLAVGVVSAASLEVVRTDLAALGLTGAMTFVVRAAHPKRAALAYSGDTEYDMEEALAAGSVPIGFPGGYRPAAALAAAGAHTVVRHLREVPEVILGPPP